MPRTRSKPWRVALRAERDLPSGVLGRNNACLGRKAPFAVRRRDP